MNWFRRLRGGKVPTLRLSDVESRWLESTQQVARWEHMLKSGRRWGAWGAAIGTLIGVLAHAPAAWLAGQIERQTAGRLVLADAQGTVWRGDAVLVLTGGSGSRDARVLPGRLGWQLRLGGWGALRLSLQQDCCLPEPLTVRIQPGWGHLDLALSGGTPDAEVRGVWPAAWLAGLGTPWNTLDLSGTFQLQGRGLGARWSASAVQMRGQADLVFVQLGSRLTTLDALGSYRLSLSAQPGQSGMDISLQTEQGALRLQGQGSLGPAGLRFRGEARASDAEREALNNLLNIIGRRQGELSVISIG